MSQLFQILVVFLTVSILSFNSAHSQYNNGRPIQFPEENSYQDNHLQNNYNIGARCNSDYDCVRSLGALSRCEGNQRCQCYDTTSFGKSPVGYYNGKCHYLRGPTDPCTCDEECKLGYHHNAVCTATRGSSTGFETCQCALGQRCGDNGSGSDSIGLSSILISITAVTIVVMSLYK